jgi:hypothetical protein
MVESRHVSLVALLSSPESYSGKRVRTAGVMRVGFEHSALYLTKEQAELGIIANSVWLNLGAYSEDGEELSGRYVEVVGIFDPGDKGHLRGWTASTGDISSLIPLEPPSEVSK